MLINRNIFKTFILCAVGCILRILGSPTFVCVCIVPAGRGSVFGNSPKYKGNSARFFFNKVSCRYTRDMSLCASHGLGGVVTKGHEHQQNQPF